jgi:hypothetical protein
MERDPLTTPRMEDVIKWLEVARSWRQTTKEEDPVQGVREALVRSFSKSRGINPSSLRRCAAALDYAEALQSSKVIKKVEDIAEVSLEKLTLLNRTVRSLRQAEVDIRAELVEAAASRKGANALVSLLGGATFRDAAVEAYRAATEADGRQAKRLTSRIGFIESAHVIARTMPGGPFQAARIVPAVGLGPDPGRHAATVALAVALARVFERFDVIVQSPDDGEQIAVGIRRVGPCGAGVLLLAADGSLEKIHQASRTEAPDLLATHVRDLDARFPSFKTTTAQAPAGDNGEAGRKARK